MPQSTGVSRMQMKTAWRTTGSRDMIRTVGLLVTTLAVFAQAIDWQLLEILENYE